MKMFTTLKNAMLVAALFVAGSAFAQVTLIETNFAGKDLSPFTAVSVSGEGEWYADVYNDNSYAKVSGYNKGANEDWLISPKMDLTGTTAATLTFDHAAKFGNANNYGNDLTIWFSTDFTDGGDVSSANWEKVTIPTYPDGTNWTFIEGVVINFPSAVYNKSNVHFAFKYMCNSSSAATWEVTNISAVATTSTAATLEFSNSVYFPGQVINTAAAAQTLTVAANNLDQAPTYQVTGADAAAFQVTGNLTTAGGDLSVVFTPAKEGMNEAVLTVTSGSTSVDYNFSFRGLPENTVLWNEFGTTLDPFTTFNNMGEQEWVADSHHYAKMSGYAGEAKENEDWLVSSALDFTNKENATLSFDHTCKFAGTMETELTLWYSTTYNGNGTFNSADWTQITISTYPTNLDYNFVNNSVVLPAEAQGAANVHFAFKYVSTTQTAPMWEIDNVLVTATNADGINDAAMDATKVYTENNTIVVEGATTAVKVYNVAGQVVASAPAAETVRVNANNGKGLYIVAVGNKAHKVIVK
jgi:hypothetical protein